MNPKQALKDFGLKEKVAKIYLSLLKNDASAQELANKTGLIRQVVYDNVKELIALGLVSVYTTGKTKKYRAKDPKHLLYLLDQKKEGITSVLSDLRSLKEEQSYKSHTESFHGMKGLKNLLALLLETKEPLYWIANYKLAHKILQEHVFYNFTLKRVEEKIPLHIIIEPTRIPKKELSVWKSDARSHRKLRIHTSVKKMPGMMVVTANKVIFFSLGQEPIQGVLIEDMSIARLQQVLFKTLWDTSKQLT